MERGASMSLARKLEAMRLINRRLKGGNARLLTKIRSTSKWISYNTGRCSKYLRTLNPTSRYLIARQLQYPRTWKIHVVPAGKVARQLLPQAVSLSISSCNPSSTRFRGIMHQRIRSRSHGRQTANHAQDALRLCFRYS
jgi:hypothetical protein